MLSDVRNGLGMSDVKPVVSVSVSDLYLFAIFTI